MNIINLFILASIGMASIYPSLYGQENSYAIHQKAAISSAAGVPWRAGYQIELLQKADNVRSQFESSLTQKKNYPISLEDLEMIYAEAQSRTIPFFTYSSMIDKEAGSVKALSQEAAATQIPALAFGLQRLFNREMAAATVEGGWGPLQRPNDLAILNVFEKEDALLNGVIFELPLSDLLILSKREVGYDLIPVLAMRWNDAKQEEKEPEIFVAYTFKAPDYQDTGVRYTSPHVNPIPGYFTYLQKGLNLQGEDFKAMWWATTYLADKKTPVSELPYQIVDLKK